MERPKPSKELVRTAHSRRVLTYDIPETLHLTVSIKKILTGSAARDEYNPRKHLLVCRASVEKFIFDYMELWNHGATAAAPRSADCGFQFECFDQEESTRVCTRKKNSIQNCAKKPSHHRRPQAGRVAFLRRKSASATVARVFVAALEECQLRGHAIALALQLLEVALEPIPAVPVVAHLAVQIAVALLVVGQHFRTLVAFLEVLLLVPSERAQAVLVLLLGGAQPLPQLLVFRLEAGVLVGHAHCANVHDAHVAKGAGAAADRADPAGGVRLAHDDVGALSTEHVAALEAGRRLRTVREMFLAHRTQRRVVLLSRVHIIGSLLVSVAAATHTGR
ncbi:hypothetical protein ACFE04_008277 [Oxalis oulophora]